MDIDKRLRELAARLAYVNDVFGPKGGANHRLMNSRLGEFLDRRSAMDPDEQLRRLVQLEDLFAFLEKKLAAELTPMDLVRIVRHPQRVCLKDILENVYDNYTEIGGKDEFSIDPSMLIARAYFTRRVGERVVNQSVMVIGQEKGHGEEFRNGGSVKPWGNAKALHYMRVAETENIPVHSFVFTPGAYPIEDYPGAAQQIARNLYEMAALKVPVICVVSEGGSGGAEAVALADKRLMLSHGYYSVISPEGAAAIEAGLRLGQKAPPALADKCARLLKITAADNLRFGYVDRIVPEPALGARVQDYDFFKLLRGELIMATNEVVGAVKGMKLFRALAMRRGANREAFEVENIFMRWTLNAKARERLVLRRRRKYRAMSRKARLDGRSVLRRAWMAVQGAVWGINSFFRHDLLGKHRRRMQRVMEEIGAEAHLVRERVGRPVRSFLDRVSGRERLASDEARQRLTRLSRPEEGLCRPEGEWAYLSPKSREDRTETCPNAETHGCRDLWAPDLYGEFAGVCDCCGHHFPMEYEWYLHNVFNYSPSREFNSEIESVNPLSYEGFGLKLEQAKKNSGRKSACVTFETEMQDVKAVVAVLTATFRGGTVGAAEGEKFILAAERAMSKRFPLIAYVHGTAGIRIHEGTHGVIQMPRCVMAVRRYIDAGGLYLVLYDTNSYAGPVASFLGCSPYQFAVRSSNIGFAGPGVILETTGLETPPHYQGAYQALARGHIHGVWDRREIGRNLYQALMTMGGRNLYYR
ncbi:MAG: carboxyl transferase domain-containing protein [Desulfovibrionaceae bacterium]|nr:carboxyl transferase domain-containing protein [Desulfovibrionaceae bacterium]